VGGVSVVTGLGTRLSKKKGGGGPGVGFLKGHTTVWVPHRKGTAARAVAMSIAGSAVTGTARP
jgi:hypothetical protein